MSAGLKSDKLNELAAECWKAFDRVAGCSFVVRPAIPILYFGDSNRYFSSIRRIVTVGLNPSKLEFPEDCPLRRFPAAEAMALDPRQRASSCHRAALDSYFRTDAYKSWFSSFEPILNGLDASFYDGKASTAVHTDLCSPIATDPTWSKLPKESKLLLESDGMNIWHSLIEALAPDVILVSIAKSYLDRIRFRAIAAPIVIWKSEANRPYEILGTQVEISSAKPSLIVFGRAAQKPFGTLNTPHKGDIGAAVKEHYRAIKECAVLRPIHPPGQGASSGPRREEGLEPKSPQA